MNADAYNGARLENLRKLHGLTQRALSETLAISQPTLSRIERGDLHFGAELAHTASAHFNEPLSFFEVPSGAVVLGPTAFRRKAATRAAERDRITALYEEAARVFSHVSEASGFHPATVIAELRALGPEDAAAAFRRLAGADRMQPVANLTRLLERVGIGVITELDEPEFSHDRADVSGITMPTARNTRPLVALAAIARGDVQRLTVAHEVGHLVLDQDAPAVSCSTRSPQETAAYQFGGALLLPAHVIRSQITEASTFRDYLELKAEYGISVAAIIKRAQTLQLISDDRARTLQIQHSSRGWRFDEPVEVATERPILLRQALAQVYPAGTYARGAHALGVRPDRLQRWAASNHDTPADQPTTSPHLAPITPLRRRA